MNTRRSADSRSTTHSAGRASLRRLLKEGALRRAARDLGLANDWFLLEEAAERYQIPHKPASSRDPERKETWP